MSKTAAWPTRPTAKRSNEPLELSRLIVEFLLLTLLTLSCRLPFFFESVIDWDESTFILIGQSILDGHLPYTQLWDLKSPFLYGFFSLAILLFGKTIASVRLAGALIVALTAFAVNRTTQRLWTVQAGWLAGVLSVLMISVLPGGQSVMGEHLAILPMSLALWLLVVRGATTTSLFYSGLLISTAAMVRLNLAYVAVGVGLYLLALALSQPLGKQIRAVFAYSLGGIIPIFLGFLPYWIVGIPKVWWTSVVVSSFYRANAGLGSHKVALVFIYKILESFWSWHGFGLQILFWLGAIAGVRHIVKRQTQLRPQQQFGWALVIVFTLTIQLSILNGGLDHAHYLIQLVPFFAMFSSVFTEAIIRRSGRVFTVVVLLLCLGTYPVFDQYATLTPRLLSGTQLDRSSARQVANYLLDQGLEDRSIYIMNQHLAYWYLGTYPLTRSTTHPSTIGRDYLLQILHGPSWSSPQEMRRVLDLKPEVIIKKDTLFYLTDQPETVEILETAITQNYTFIHSVNELKIYAAKDLSAAENE